MLPKRVKRRMQNARSKNSVATSELFKKLARSSLALLKSSTFSLSWLLTVTSSSLTDCSSSLEVSSSSLVDCNSSLIARTSSLAAVNSSWVTWKLSMAVWRSCFSRRLSASSWVATSLS